MKHKHILLTLLITLLTSSAAIATKTTLVGKKTFLGLDDTPDTYSGSNGYLLQVNGSVIEFVDSSSLSGIITETDPVFIASDAFDITSTDITNLSNLSGTNTGDQDLSGYQLISGMATDVPANETDPVYSVSEAFNIDSTDITNINNLSGVNTGDQDLSGYELSSSLSTDVPAHETDPLFSMSSAYSITGTDITNLSNLSGVNTGDQDLSGYELSSSLSTDVPAHETDPVFTFSSANSITGTDITNLSNLSGVNTGDQDTFVTIASPGQTSITANSSTDTLNIEGNGVTITTDSGTNTLTINADIPPSDLTINGTMITNGGVGAVLFVGADNTLAQDNGHLFYNNTDNFLGIGTNTPASTLEVSSDSASDDTAITINNTSSSGPDNGVPYKLISTGASSFYGPGKFIIYEANSAEHRLTISGPNVGIGTTEPNYNLDVTGTLGVSSDAYVAGYIGVNDTTPDYPLDVQGTAMVTTLNVNGAYALPNTVSGASNGYVLTYDNNGESIWAELPPTSGYLEQAFTDQTSVTVTHNFGKRPIVQVLTTNGDAEVYANINHTSLNEFVVTFPEATNGSVLATLGAPFVSGGGGSGTVTSVAISVDNGLTINSGSPVTTSGTIALTINRDSFTPVNSVSTNTTLDDTYEIVLVDATSGTVTIVLPTAVGITGRKYYVKKIDSSSNLVTIDGNGSETIDDALTQSIGTRYNVFMVVSNGTNWSIL